MRRIHVWEECRGDGRPLESVAQEAKSRSLLYPGVELPDVEVILGDRFAALEHAMNMVHCDTLLAHIHGGELTGNWDDKFRHGITKLADIHFPATEKSAERIRQMGEEPWRIHVCGAPGLDRIRKLEYDGKLDDLVKFGVVGGAYLLVVLHPETGHGAANPDALVNATVAACERTGCPVVWLAPCNDTGHRRIADIAWKACSKDTWQYHVELPSIEYLTLLKHAACAVGNSSSFIIEAATFGTPVVNIGSRQRNRERARNVLDSPVKASVITSLVEQQIGRRWKVTNPYGDGYAAGRIVDVLETVDLDKLRQPKEWYCGV